MSPFQPWDIVVVQTGAEMERLEMNSLGKRFRLARSLSDLVLRIVLGSPLRGKNQALSQHSAALGSILAGSALFCASARLIDAPFCKPSAEAELKEVVVPPFFSQSSALCFNRRCATTPRQYSWQQDSLNHEDSDNGTYM
jgi:hypothetical protein